MATTASGFACMACGTTFKRKGDFNVHYKNVHSDQDVRFQCPACKKVSLNRKSFKMHIYRNHKNLAGLDLEKYKISYKEG